MARPRSLEGALDVLGEVPTAQVVAGGTDFMVEVNYGLRRLEAVVALRRVDELRGWQRQGRYLALGAGLTYTEMERELAGVLPAMAAAARTVGSPPIRNAGTLGGNLGTASPAGDTLPLLAALDAEVAVSRRDGDRRVPLKEFIIGAKRTSLKPGEIIREVTVPLLTGPQVFLKVGSRNAMVISVAGCVVVLDLERQWVRCGLGAVAPVPVRPSAAEALASAEIDWERGKVSEDVVQHFGELAAAAASPIDDHRSTAAYRGHAIAVIARRGLQRAVRQLSVPG